MRSVQELFEEMAAAFQRETGQAVAPAGDMAVRLYAVAAQIWGLYAQSDWVGRQCFPQTAEGAFLDRHAQLRSVERRPAARSEGTLRFTLSGVGSEAVAVPAGTVCMTAAQVRFETVEDAVVPAGSLWAEAKARAVEPGEAGNAAAGSIHTMAVAPVGVRSCTNSSSFTGGAKEEDDEALRARVLETFRRLPNGANAAFYEQTALAAPGVAAASVLPRSRGIGTVDVVVSGPSGTPEAAVLEALGRTLQERREIAVDVRVRAPEEKTADVAVRIKAAEGRRFADVRAAAEARIQGWFDGRRLGKSVLRAELGELVFSTEGVANYALDAPAADLPMEADELPRLGTLTVTELGGTA